jgi:tetratricopeptide (TPR) repeat protein
MRPTALRLASLLALSAGVAAAAAAQAPAGQSATALSQQCQRAAAPARYPDVRPRVQAAARQGGAAGAFAQGCLHLADDRYPQAATAFEQAVRADDRSAVYHFYLGQAYGAQAQRASMLSKLSLARKTKSEFDRAVQLDPDFVEAREGLMQYYLQAPSVAGGSQEKAREQAYEIRKRDPYRGAWVYAGLAWRQKDTASTVREFEGIIRQFPDSAGAYGQLVGIHAGQRRWPEAWAVVDRMQRALPASPLGAYHAGRVAAESGAQLERGAAGLARYLQTTPAPWEPPLANAHWRLGAVYEHQGRRDAARAEYEAAVKLNPRLKGASDALARLR